MYNEKDHDKKYEKEDEACRNKKELIADMLREISKLPLKKQKALRAIIRLFKHIEK